MDAGIELPLRRVVLCLRHGIIYILPSVCSLCYLISIDNINRRNFARTYDASLDPLIDVDEEDVGNGLFAPSLLARAVHVEDYFRGTSEHERTRLGVPANYRSWSSPWNNIEILRLRIPFQRRIQNIPPIRLYLSMNSPMNTPSQSPLSSPQPSSTSTSTTTERQTEQLTILDNQSSPATPSPSSPTRTFVFPSPQGFPSPPARSNQQFSEFNSDSEFGFESGFTSVSDFNLDAAWGGVFIKGVFDFKFGLENDLERTSVRLRAHKGTQ